MSPGSLKYHKVTLGDGGHFMRLIRRREVEEMTDLSKTTIYRLMRQSDFPEPLKMGARAVRWNKDEIEDWVAKRERASRRASRIGA